jgi:hypothetical protein
VKINNRTDWHTEKWKQVYQEGRQKCRREPISKYIRRADKKKGEQYGQGKENES